MIPVIQCAASKRNAGWFRDSHGAEVEFVSHPEFACETESRVYARPDDLTEDGITWRHAVLRYNRSPGCNPQGLLPAYQLYTPPAYQRLADRFGPANVYILSAGWGLVRSDFLLPHYNITLSKNPKVPRWSRRQRADRYDDFCMLPDEPNDVLVFAGGLDYLPLFSALTANVRVRKVVWYSATAEPRVVGCEVRRFETARRTNWHYDLVDALVEGRLDPASSVNSTP